MFLFDTCESLTSVMHFIVTINVMHFIVTIATRQCYYSVSWRFLSKLETYEYNKVLNDLYVKKNKLAKTIKKKPKLWP